MITFILSHVVPGNPAYVVIGPEVNPQELKVLEAEMGLNKPLYVQFYIYLVGLLHGNLGYSYVQGLPVNYLISHRFPVSFELAVATVVVSIPLAVMLGVYASLRVNKAGDHASRVFALLGISMPVFFIGIVLILVYYVNLGIAPAPLGQLNPLAIPPPRITGLVIVDSFLSGQFGNFLDAIWHIILPAAALGFAGLATISRITRSSMLEVIGKDYMRTSFAIGLPRKLIVNKYALRNALLPTITVAAIQTGAIMGGVVLTEEIFSWPGLGQLAVNAIYNSDYPTIMAVVLVSAILFVIFNFIADILYAYIDPRVSLQ